MVESSCSSSSSFSISIVGNPGVGISSISSIDCGSAAGGYVGV
jgi:hypothetical protein